MDVLDDEQHGLPGGQPREHAVNGLEQLLPVTAAARIRTGDGPQRAQRRAQRRLDSGKRFRIRYHRPQRGDDRGESQFALGKRQAFAGQHSHPGGLPAGLEPGH
jgi:hypothetical protein